MFSLFCKQEHAEEENAVVLTLEIMSQECAPRLGGSDIIGSITGARTLRAAVPNQ